MRRTRSGPGPRMATARRSTAPQNSRSYATTPSPLAGQKGGGSTLGEGRSDGDGQKTVKVCIVGSGPAGFYTAKYLLAQYAPSAPATSDGDNGGESASATKVDITLMDRYPTPYGLVRFGVAPDHPEVKVVSNDFQKTMEKYADRCHFVGNVELGSDVTYDELRQMFDVVVLTYGASHERMLGIPGERDIESGVESAREFVSWYNALPEKDNMEEKSTGDAWSIERATEKYSTLLSRAKKVVIIGQGNVALDVARILAKSIKDLSQYDLPDYALQTLDQSTKDIRNILVMGRRGPVQAACTTKELRELTKIDGVKLFIDPQELELDDISMEELEREGRVKKRLLDVMRKNVTPGSSAEKTIQLTFNRNPKEFLSDEEGRLRAVRVEHTNLQKTPNGAVIAVGSGETEDIECDLVLKSVGYMSVPVDGVPFDSRKGIVPNREGRVLQSMDTVSVPSVQTGVYACGWLKRGPSGVILSNIVDAKETVNVICQDIDADTFKLQDNAPPKPGRQGLWEILTQRSVQYVDFQQYRELEQKEIEEGQRKGKLREKMTRVEEMLQAANAKRE